MNIIAQYQRAHGLKDCELARVVGLDRATVTHHRLGSKPIGGEAALRYHRALGIPLSSLRPDLYPETISVTSGSGDENAGAVVTA